MLQTILASGIVIIATAWLLWTLFLPASLRRKLRPTTVAGDCSTGCASCNACPPHARNTGRSVVMHKDPR